MSNQLSDVRGQVKALLSGGSVKLRDKTVQAHAVIPPKAIPPMAYVAPDLPYLTYDGAGFGAMWVRLKVHVIAPAGINDKAADDLDDLLLQVLDALGVAERAGQLVVGDVDVALEPINNNDYLGATVEVSIETHRS